MLLELTTAAFFFVVGLVLAGISFEFKPPYNAPFLILAGLMWLVLGAFSLTGNIIQGQSYIFNNVTYSTIAGSSVITGINQTIQYLPLTSSSSGFNLATVGIFGFGLIGIGLFALMVVVFQLIDWNSGRNEIKEV